MQKVIIVLGSENSENGELGSIAKDRLKKCLEIFSDDYLIACSGGWGAHFNVSENPHAQYAIDFLLGNGISKEVILPPILSEHTVDDAVKIKSFFKNKKDFEILIVTSDFHLERVELIFEEVLKGYKLAFLPAKSSLSKSQFLEKVDHEKKAVASILENGLYY